MESGIKKQRSIWLVAFMLIILTGCKGASNQKVELVDKQLVIWSYTDEFVSELEGFEIKYGIEVVLEIYDEDELEVLAASLMENGQETPDVIVTSREGILSNELSPLLQDLTAFIHENQGEDRLYPYAYESGLNNQGSVVGITYQLNPTALFYRRSLAEIGLNTQDPAELEKYFGNYTDMMAVASRLKDKNIMLFPDIYMVRYFLNLHEPQDNFELIKQLLLKNQVGDYVEWTDDWLLKMAQTVGDETEEAVFGYVLPSWALGNTIMLVNDLTEVNGVQELEIYNKTERDWGLIRLSEPENIGGTYIGINKSTAYLDEAEKFIHYMVFDQEHLDQWLGESDMICSLVEVQERQDYEAGNRFLGGQNYHDFFGESAMRLRAEQKFTASENKMKEIYRETIFNYIGGQYHTIDEAIADFKSRAEALFN